MSPAYGWGRLEPMNRAAPLDRSKLVTAHFPASIPTSLTESHQQRAVTGKILRACKEGRLSRQSSRDIFQMTVLLANLQDEGLMASGLTAGFTVEKTSKLSISEEVEPARILTQFPCGQ